MVNPTTMKLNLTKQKITEKPKKDKPNWAFSNKILDGDFSNLKFKEDEAMFHLTNITNGLINILAVIDIDRDYEKITGLKGYPLTLAIKRKKWLTKEKIVAILNLVVKSHRQLKDGILTQEMILIQILNKLKGESLWTQNKEYKNN